MEQARATRAKIADDDAARRFADPGSDVFFGVPRFRGKESISVDDATGRLPNVEGPNLEAAGVEFGGKSGIHVDDRLHTTNPKIFAAGDVCLPHKFTHVADPSARIAVRSALLAGRANPAGHAIPARARKRRAQGAGRRTDDDSFARVALGADAGGGRGTRAGRPPGGAARKDVATKGTRGPSPRGAQGATDPGQEAISVPRRTRRITSWTYSPAALVARRPRPSFRLAARETSAFERRPHAHVLRVARVSSSSGVFNLL